jgi:hypothetical protein
MKLDHQGTMKVINLFVIFLLVLVGCKGGLDESSPTQTINMPPTQDRSGLSNDAISTLNSLEKLDDYPFFVMHYTGEYSYPQIGSISANEANFGCSLFAALGTPGDMLFGRNFDWEFSPALLVFTEPPDGYASASMVDLTFLGITTSDAMALTELPVDERTDLLAAPSLPFDGINEYGLTIGMAAVPDEYADDTSYDPSKPTIGSIGIIRQVLDHARNVDEAADIFGQYNLRFYGGPPIHYLLADPSGKGVLIEFFQGEMKVLPNTDPWHLATNHLRCIAQGDGGCWRYRSLSEHLMNQNGRLDLQSGMQLLSQVKQDSTQWSTVYDMTSGDIQVVIGRDYSTTHTFHIDIVKQ